MELILRVFRFRMMLKGHCHCLDTGVHMVFDSAVVTICTARFNVQQFYVLPHTLYLCVLCGSENKQRLFPYTALTD